MSKAILNSELAAGTRLGVFEIRGLIGRGGMGAVYDAMDTAIHRRVALKTVNASVANDENYIVRFRREAHAASRVQNPYVVTIHALGTHAGVPYMVMEYVEGSTLAALIEQGPLSVERAAFFMQGIC